MKTETYRMMRNLEDHHWWFVGRRRIIGKLLDRLVKNNRPAILEVGCGTGGNIRMLQQFGEVTCVEYDEFAAELARDRKLAPVLAGELPDGLPALRHDFGLVLALDVIEHIDDDEASLGALARLLETEGRIVLTVPAFNFLWSIHDDENHHKRRYRKRDIQKLARICDLEIEYLSYFNFWLFLPVALVRLVRKVIPYRESWQDMKIPGRGVNKMLEALFASERFAMGRWSLPFGISLVGVLAKKPGTATGEPASSDGPG
jgi:SAM-dependent methyltransferase